MDRMAEGAVIFNNAYCFGGNSGAVCIPSRNMLMSGRTFFRFEEDCLRMKANGEESRNMHYTNPDWATIPKSMKEAIELRQKFPESSLNELSDYSYDVFNKTISKSALNHRFRNINILADQIIENLHE